MFVQVSEQQLPRSIHTKTLNRGNSDWSGCRRSTRKQIVPERPSNRLQTLVTEWEPVLNSSVKRNSANLVGEVRRAENGKWHFKWIDYKWRGCGCCTTEDAEVTSSWGLRRILHDGVFEFNIILHYFNMYLMINQSIGQNSNCDLMVDRYKV